MIEIGGNPIDCNNLQEFLEFAEAEYDRWQARLSCSFNEFMLEVSGRLGELENFKNMHPVREAIDWAMQDLICYD